MIRNKIEFITRSKRLKVDEPNSVWVNERNLENKLKDSWILFNWLGKHEGYFIQREWHV